VAIVFCRNYGLAACPRLAVLGGAEAFLALLSPDKQTIDFILFFG
jgi:hypothetical protein